MPYGGVAFTSTLRLSSIQLSLQGLGQRMRALARVMASPKFGVKDHLTLRPLGELPSTVYAGNFFPLQPIGLHNN